MSTDLANEQAPQTCSKPQSNSSPLNSDAANDDSKVEVMVLSKSDKTLTKNIDAKDDSLRKRTSLIIVPQKDSPDMEDYSSNNITHNMSSSTIDNENCNELVSDNDKTMEKSSTKSLESSICSNHSATDEEDLNELNKKTLNANKCDIKRQSLADSVDSCVSRSNSSATNCSSATSASISTSSSSKSSSSGDDVILDEDYQDLENGNIIEDLEAERKNCISNASSCIDDYSLRQKYEEYVNAKTQDANGGDTSTDADEGNIEGDDDELAESDAIQDQRQATTKSSLSLSSSAVHEHNEGGLLGSNFDEFDTQPRSLPACDALLSP